jgi:hypothetical protein
VDQADAQLGAIAGQGLIGEAGAIIDVVFPAALCAAPGGARWRARPAAS